MSLGFLIVIGVLLLGFFGVGLGLKSRAGSEIEKHPSDGLSRGGGEGAPQASGSSRLLEHEDGGHDSFDTHGTG
jgi:hypothetical protein